MNPFENFSQAIDNSTKSAGILVISADGKVIGFSSKKRNYATCIPGGKREDGEPPSITAGRECLEETGLEFTITENTDAFICYSDDHPNNYCAAYIIRLDKASDEVPIPESADNDGGSSWMTPTEFIARTSFPYYNKALLRYAGVEFQES